MRFALALSLVVSLFAQEPADIDQLEKTARAGFAKGDYAGARADLEIAYELAQQIPPKDPKRYELLKLLSGVLSAAGDYAAAQNYVELAINWRETAIGPEDPQLADEWIELASLCERQKDFERALALLTRAQQTHSRENGAKSLPVADDFSRIALVYMGERKPDLAAPALVKTIAIREAVLGADKPCHSCRARSSRRRLDRDARMCQSGRDVTPRAGDSRAAPGADARRPDSEHRNPGLRAVRSEKIRRS